MTELEEAELTDGQGRALSAHKSQQAYEGYAKPRWNALCPLRASAMLIDWRTRREQTFRMSRGTTFRITIAPKLKSQLNNWS